MRTDTEVEEVLREIRQHLRAGVEPRPNGGGDPSGRPLAQIESDLSITERAWGRLPPVQSERRGLASRLELWLKRRLKSATRWFTWEQINFNAAVNHALRAAHALLSAHDKEIRELRAEVALLTEEARELRRLRAEVARLRADDGGAHNNANNDGDGGGRMGQSA